MTTRYIETENGLSDFIWQIAHETPAIDAYTQLRDLRLGDDRFLWGLDRLLTTEPLVADYFRTAPHSLAEPEREMTPVEFSALSIEQRADLIWREIFVARSPLSEHARGILTVFGLLGINPNERDLAFYRKVFSTYDLRPHLRHVFKIANLRAVVMKNDPLSGSEQEIWNNASIREPAFLSALSLDGLLEWEISGAFLRNQGFIADTELNKITYDGVIKFIDHWLRQTSAVYCSLSVNGSFDLFAKKNSTMRILRKCILPFCEKLKLPLALVISAQYDTDSIGAAADTAALTSIEELCANFPDNKFLVAALSATSQRLLSGIASRFNNLMPFGCAWNTPSTMQETAKISLELLGDGFIPHYSGAETLEQLLYKWAHARWTLGKTLQQQYLDLHRTGWRLTEEEIKRDINNMLQNNFLKFVGISA